MKIVLVRPNYPTYFITPSLGVGYLSSYMKKNGIDVKIIDGVKNSLSQEQIIDEIQKENPDAVGITCLSSFYEEVKDLSLALKSKGQKVIIGGVMPTFIPYQTLKETKADYVICGEGEIALTALALNGFVNNKIKGIYSINDLEDENTPTERADIIENLDELPFPDWEEMQPQTYPLAPMGMIAKQHPLTTIMSSRGCPFPCVFCASSAFYKKKVRFRSPESVVSEMKYLIDNFGIKEIQFVDDNLILKREHAEKICNLILEQNIKVDWSCPNGIRADMLDLELAKLMKKAGCYLVTFGIESANPQILLNIKKKETIEQIEKAINIANEAGIITNGSFVLGLPGDTKETIRESIDFAKKSKLNRALFTIMDVLVGCELWEKNKDNIKPILNKNSYTKPILIPEGLTEEYLLKMQSQALREFYFRPKIMFDMIKLIRPHQFKHILNRLLKYRLI